jgi:hypothetical protein
VMMIAFYGLFFTQQKWGTWSISTVSDLSGSLCLTGFKVLFLEAA